MPFEKSPSKGATERNFSHFRHGKTFKKTAARHGTEKARKQMIAAVLSNKRKAATKRKAKTRKASR
jgi:hypothetical protein